MKKRCELLVTTIVANRQLGSAATSSAVSGWRGERREEERKSKQQIHLKKKRNKTLSWSKNSVVIDFFSSVRRSLLSKFVCSTSLLALICFRNWKISKLANN